MKARAGTDQAEQEVDRSEPRGDQAEHRSRAELECTKPRLTEDTETHTVRQSPTRTGAVARYVGYRIGNYNLPVLTNNNQGIDSEKDQADQTDQAEPLMQQDQNETDGWPGGRAEH